MDMERQFGALLQQDFSLKNIWMESLKIAEDRRVLTFIRRVCSKTYSKINVKILTHNSDAKNLETLKGLAAYAKEIGVTLP